MSQGIGLTCDYPGCTAVLVADTQRWATLEDYAHRKGWHFGDAQVTDDLCPEHDWTKRLPRTEEDR